MSRLSTENTNDIHCAWQPFGSRDAAPADIAQLAAFLDGIPGNIHRLLKPIKFRKEEITLLVRAFPESVDLLRDAPILLMLICDQRAKGGIPQSDIEALLASSRREICKALGGSGTKSELGFLLKIRFQALNNIAVTLSRQVLGNRPVMDAVRLLHLNYADNGLVELLLGHTETFACPSLRKQVEHFYSGRLKPDDPDLPSFGEIKSLAYTISDVYRMARHGGLPDATNQLSKLTTKAAVIQLHDRMNMKTEMESYKSDRLFRSDFGPPPVEGNKDIIPIQTFAELCEESQTMHHCVHSYCTSIWEKDYYVYKVMAPERATLGVRLAQNGEWKIDELRLLCNAAPSEETVQAVWEWFGKQMKS